MRPSLKMDNQEDYSLPKEMLIVVIGGGRVRSVSAGPCRNPGGPDKALRKRFRPKAGAVR